MEVRELDLGDLDRVQDMLTAIFSRAPWNDHWEDRGQLRRYVLELMGAPNSLSLGLFEGEDLIGLALGRVKHWWEGTEYWIDEFGLLPEHQGQGAGTRFLTMMGRCLRERQMAAIVLLTDRRAPACRFYEKNGFTEQKDQVFLTKALAAPECSGIPQSPQL